MGARQNDNAAKSEPDQKLVDLIKELVSNQEKHDSINESLENIKKRLENIKQRLQDKDKKTDGFKWLWRKNPSQDEENKEIDEAKKEIDELNKEIRKISKYEREVNKDIDECLKKIRNELKSAQQAESKLLKEDELSLLEEEIGRFEDDVTIWEDSSRLARLGVHFMEQLYATKDLKTVAERYKEVAEAIKYLGTVPEKNAIRKKWFDTIDGMEKPFKKVMERVISKEPEPRNDASGKPEDTTERETGTNDQDKAESKPNGHEEALITPENERYCAGGGEPRSIIFLETWILKPNVTHKTDSYPGMNR